jgi:hypothetical protein
MDIRMDDLHRRWLDTPCEPVAIDEVPNPEPTPHPEPNDPPPTAGVGAAEPTGVHARDSVEGGSGTAGATTREKDQAGSFARDAEQDPDGERHGRSDADR